MLRHMLGEIKHNEKFWEQQQDVLLLLANEYLDCNTDSACFLFA